MMEIFRAFALAGESALIHREVASYFGIRDLKMSLLTAHVIAMQIARADAERLNPCPTETARY